MKTCPICQGADVVFERTLNSISLTKCIRCDFVYADLDDNFIEEVNERYGHDAVQNYETYQTLFDKLWALRLATRFTRQSGQGKVLDVGCGNGLLLNQFKTLGWECYGIDPSPWSKIYAEKYGFTFFQEKPEHPLSDFGGFDFVVSSSTLEHIAQPRFHIQAILRLLNKGGTAYFCGIPNYASLPVKLGVSDFYMNCPPGHVNYFTVNSLERLFYAAGMPSEKVNVRTYGIPEAHKIYNKITKMFFAKRHPAIPMRIDSKQEVRTQNRNNNTNSAIRKIFCTFIVSAFYHAGRIGGFGDKLEATLVK